MCLGLAPRKIPGRTSRNRAQHIMGTIRRCDDATTEIVICGPCEIGCAVMRAGRVCPTISEFRAEVRALGIAA